MQNVRSKRGQRAFSSALHTGSSTGLNATQTLLPAQLSGSQLKTVQ